jgi:glycosyltransferase involved in cell wall biosynthesis
MKIAVLAASEVPSSTANSIQTMKTSQALRQAGHEVRLWVPGRETTEWDRLADHYGVSTPFEIQWLSSPPVLKRYDFAVRAVWDAKTWGADVIYTWMIQSAFFGILLKIPVILELHMLPTGLIGPNLFRICVRSKAKKRFLIITAALRDLLEKTQDVRFNFSDVQIAPMGSEPERYDISGGAVEARRVLGLPEGSLVGYTGHFYPGRGMETLLALATAYPAFQFLWVGGNPDDVEFWRGRLEEGEIENVILTGFVENSRLPLYQSAADILLMPYGSSVAVSSGGDTVDVCSPMKMFEYMAAGRAILSSDLPVLREVLNTENAAFCPPDVPEAWVHALGELLSDPERCTQLGEQARKDAQAYTWVARARRSLVGISDNQQ